MSLSIPLYTGGRLEHQREARGYALNAADLTVENRCQEVRYNTRAAYYRALQYRDLIGVRQGTIKALQEHGRRVPEDVSVIAIDGLEISSYTIPTLSTMAQPAEEMGRESVKLLMEVMDGGSHRHIRLEPAFRAGASLRTL